MHILKSGHTVQQCPLFYLAPRNSQPNLQLQASNQWQFRPSALRQPPTKVVTTDNSKDSSWLLDSGASHYVTTDQSNLLTHAPYSGDDDVVIGDGTCVSNSHTSSLTLYTLSLTFTLHNVLFVPSMHKNLISISQFCKSNDESIEFFTCSSFVEDLHTGAILVRD